MLLWILVAVLGKPLKTDTYTDFTYDTFKPTEASYPSYAVGTGTKKPYATEHVKPKTYMPITPEASHPSYTAGTTFGPKPYATASVGTKYPASVGTKYPATKKPVFTVAPRTHHYVQPNTRSPVDPRSIPQIREELASLEPEEVHYTTAPKPVDYTYEPSTDYPKDMTYMPEEYAYTTGSYEPMDYDNTYQPTDDTYYPKDMTYMPEEYAYTTGSYEPMNYDNTYQPTDYTYDTMYNPDTWMPEYDFTHYPSDYEPMDYDNTYHPTDYYTHDSYHMGNQMPGEYHYPMHPVDPMMPPMGPHHHMPPMGPHHHMPPMGPHHPMPPMGPHHPMPHDMHYQPHHYPGPVASHYTDHDPEMRMEEHPSYDYGYDQYYYPAGDMHMPENDDYYMNHDGYKHDEHHHYEPHYYYPSEDNHMHHDDYHMNHDGYEHADYEHYPEETNYHGSYDGHYPEETNYHGSYDGHYPDETNYHGSYDGHHPDETNYHGSYDGHHDSYGHEGEHYDHEHKDGERYESESDEDDMPECLSDCNFDGLDHESERAVCEWWDVEGPVHNPESCFNDCSPLIIQHTTKMMEQDCSEEPVEEVDPLACVMDCPIDDLDPHSAESFCPWFVKERKNECFHDCTDEFLNYAQDHAEYTCGEWEQGELKFTNFINEPMADAVAEENRDSHPLCPAGFIKKENRCEVCPAGTYSLVATFECMQCSDELTSFPGSTSEEECFERKELLPVESSDDGSYEHSDMSSGSHDSYSSDKSDEPSQ